MEVLSILKFLDGRLHEVVKDNDKGNCEVIILLSDSIYDKPFLAVVVTILKYYVSDCFSHYLIFL